MFPFNKKKQVLKPLNPNDKRYRYHFYGQVQGVGFRFVASQTAMQYQLTGWVRNESDGSVTMEIQGNPMDIKQVISRLHNDNYIEIDHYTREELNPILEDGFVPRY
ncbi:acylphosphatase [Floccifex sp.]|uniref:acylphosphatase n=1 Tax=Floccifex sp. TaxID=2815810 RepID=UPI002A749E87|nr:acylphosphatase [Floccifex sp.]MDD7282076.1 acylphosphatase [Erysipelotrichaceae bacterium]MDY2958986.1 acylphosphatase [Floccifex sp.]